jgi:putative DNA methylase
MPLVRSFALATKKGRESWIEPLVDRAQHPATIRFEVRTGKAGNPPGTVNRRGAVCLACKTQVDFDYVRAEGRAGRMGTQMMAVVAEGQRKRLYLTPDAQQERAA